MSQRNRRISVSRRRNGHLERHLLSDPSCSLDVGKYLGLPKIDPFFLLFSSEFVFWNVPRQLRMMLEPSRLLHLSLG
jgi:hypothetical protein